MMTGGDTSNHGVAGGLARHVPVMLDEAMHYLAPAAGGIFVDGTFGAGGYTRAILAAGASVIAIDRDPDAIAGGQRLATESGGRLKLFEGRFSDLDRIAGELAAERIDGVVLDVGVSSMQIDEAERGFSFARRGPLDMRMGQHGPTAADVVNTMPERELARVIAVLGEEKRARAVGAAIGRARAAGELTDTLQLADVIAGAVGRKRGDPIHPATRTFQALRIYVNRELDELAEALAASERVLIEGGRLVVVAFHSLEDRIVKRFLAERSQTRSGGSRHLPERDAPDASFALLTHGPVAPTDQEIEANPRARSARLRAARRTAARPQPLDPGAVGVPDVPHFDRRSE